MRTVRKAAKQPEFLKEWKVRFRNNKGRSAKYADLDRLPEYDALKDTLMREQYYLCCYCCNQVDQNSAHIEHFITQSNKAKGADIQLDYHNLLASCNGYFQGFSTVGRESCGHWKDDYANKNRLYSLEEIISPLDSECEQAFMFLPNGEMHPLPDNNVRANNTIAKIGLNTYALSKAREAAINVAYEEVGLSSGQPDQIDANKLQEELRYYTSPSKEGKLPAFCDAVSYLLRQL